ncbi:MAG: hypothetical protein ACRDPO_28305, partial [Streptosporangiaceae bacterium]
EAIFSLLGIVPARTGVTIPDSGVSWNYTTWLNIVFLLLAAALIVRFVRTGGGPMLRMMGGTPDSSPDDSAHDPHDHASRAATDYPA